MSINSLANVAVSSTPVQTPKAPSTDEAFAGLTKYIPTESITLYVADVSNQAALTNTWHLTPQVVYVSCILFTPVLFLLLFLRKEKERDRAQWKISPTTWPKWSIFASTIAFAVWALAVPGNPIMGDNADQGAVAAFGALFVSTLLNMLTPFFEKVSEPAIPAQADPG